MLERKIICLTPIRNEARNLRRFLSCASIWADKIIILDQHSEDKSEQIARSFPKVELRENKSSAVNEGERQAQLIAAARDFAPGSIMIALDADEIFTADSLESKEWLAIRKATPGSVFLVQRINFLPGFEQAWLDNRGNPFACGFVDDGSSHSGATIHSRRVPMTASSETIVLKEIKCLHYQYADWIAMRSKHYWYQCWEVLNRPERRACEIFRQYHHMIGMPRETFIPFVMGWTQEYVDRGIDMTTINTAGGNWWDTAVLAMVSEHGPERFKKIAIWNAEWMQSDRFGNNGRRLSKVRDPRSLLDKIIQQWLWYSQPFRERPVVKNIDDLLRKVGY